MRLGRVRPAGEDQLNTHGTPDTAAPGQHSNHLAPGCHRRRRCPGLMTIWGSPHLAPLVLSYGASPVGHHSHDLNIHSAIPGILQLLCVRFYSIMILRSNPTPFGVKNENKN